MNGPSPTQPLPIPSPAGSGEKRLTIQQGLSVQISLPLPPPDILQGYKNVDPKLLDTVVGLIQGENRHRHEMEKSSLNEHFSMIRFGQICGLTIGIVAIVAGSYTAIKGKEWAGGFIGTAGVASLIWAFRYDKKITQQEEKLEEPQPPTSPGK